MRRTAHITNKTGINSLTIINEAIKNGENVETKHRTQFGSNELTDAMFPVPNNDTKMYRICSREEKNGAYCRWKWLFLQRKRITYTDEGSLEVDILNLWDFVRFVQLLLLDEEKRNITKNENELAS